jgi:Asp-tRNA(Asn)/Glu-tRNA(Gln) amidotransferase C subunit
VTGPASRPVPDRMALVDHVATLARLELLPEERARLGRQFGEIVAFVDLLREWEEGRAPAGDTASNLPARRADDVARRWPEAETLVFVAAGFSPEGVRVPTVVDTGGDEP